MRYHYLYEYRTRLPLTELGLGEDELRQHVQQLWDNRPRNPFWRDPSDDGRPTPQRFLRFHHDGGAVEVSARNYVGQIQLGNQLLHLLPKVFCQDTCPQEPTEQHLQAIHAHLLWWLSYADRLRFPRSLASFAAVPTSLLEVLILLFAQYTHELLSRSHYQHYQELSDDLNTLRGQLRFGAYATYYATGRGHHLPCTFDSFQPDNHFNRILRYVVYRLLHLTRQPLTQRLLQEIHFQLDEVADQPATLADCDRVQLSPLFEEFRVVLDYCRLFLADSGPLAAHRTDVRVVAMLLPTEVVYEEFLAGFARNHLADEYRIQPQARDLFLATTQPADGTRQSFFQLRHDLLLQRHHPETAVLILDAKYKLPLVAADGHLLPGSVAQADMYQMVSYALRRGTPYMYLLYPDNLSQPVTDAAVDSLVYQVENNLGADSPQLDGDTNVGSMSFDRNGASKVISVAAHRLPVTAVGAFKPVGEPGLPGIAQAIAEQTELLTKRLKAILGRSL